MRANAETRFTWPYGSSKKLGSTYDETIDKSGLVGGNEPIVTGSTILSAIDCGRDLEGLPAPGSTVRYVNGLPAKAGW